MRWLGHSLVCVASEGTSPPPDRLGTPLALELRALCTDSQLAASAAAFLVYYIDSRSESQVCIGTAHREKNGNSNGRPL